MAFKRQRNSDRWTLEIELTLEEHRYSCTLLYKSLFPLKAFSMEFVSTHNFKLDIVDKPIEFGKLKSVLDDINM